ncbi:actin family protein [Sporobolomyces salmoneus]|uniref:actin family protein n=1 Tax=Sporobolomyces salmoneus TaxID=183962 RepID=UPI003172B596
MDSNQPVLVFDNGGHSIKACLTSPLDPYANLAPSRQVLHHSSSIFFLSSAYTSRIGLGADFGGLTFRVPMDKGILNNWDIEKQVWDQVFSGRGRSLQLDTRSTSIAMTEPLMNLPNVQEHYDQMVFEEYEFQSYLRIPGPATIPYGLDARGAPHIHPPECCLVIDAGFSFTHVVPILRGSIISSGVKRIDIGGKLLTNYLKELVSFRHWYMMDQTSVMEHAKESACYVSTEWEHDWEAANADTNNSIVRTYVLPDFTPESKNKLGYVRTGQTPPPTPPPLPEGEDSVDAPPAPVQEEEQLLYLCNERFAVPEVLFTPTTIELNQAGLAESIANSINSLPLDLQGMFWNNIVCVGGSVGFQGFGQRLQNDLRSLAPQEYSVRVVVSASPINAIASSLSTALSQPFVSHPPSYSHPPLHQAFVTRQEYHEMGSNACRRKFNSRFYWSERTLAAELSSG